MSPATMAQIFEPFYTTKGPHEGTGLGLSACYGIVRKMGGEIDVSSEPGHGTTFTLRLPIHAGDRQRTTEGARAPLSGDETVLLIEDEPAIRRLAERALREKGYDVITAKDGIEGLALFSEHGERIDVVFSDVVLPRGNGCETAAIVRQQRPDTPFLLTTGYTTHNTPPDCPPFPIMWKPYTPAQMLRNIRACLDVAES